jgi:hypothetical protein
VPLLRDEPDFSALASPEEWARIQRISMARGVAPLVAYAVRSHASPEQRAWCDEVLTRSWARHDASLRQLEWVLNHLNSAGVEVLVLKGPILGRRHFSPPFLRRPSKDIDLAVRDCDLERAAEVLIAAGYEPADSIAEARRTSHHLVMYIEGRPRVELHTRLHHNTRGIPVEEFFNRAARHELPGGTVARILCPADEILGLVLHFASDRFSSFFHLVELRQVWREASPELRSDVVKKAVAHKFSATLKLTELAFNVYWSESFLPNEADVPETWLQARIKPALLDQMEANIYHASEGGVTARPFNLRLEGRWLDLHNTDTPTEALKGLALLFLVSWRELVRGRWGTVYRSLPFGRVG